MSPPRRQVFVVLVRSINVGGRNKVPMADLRALATDLGVDGATTYVQSGNLVGVAAATPVRLAGDLALGLRDRLGVDVPVIVRTARAWGATMAGNPLVDADDDPRLLHVVFCDAAPTPDAASALTDRIAAGGFGRDRAVVDGDRVFLHTPDGYGDSKLTPTLLERVLGVVTTTRNWRTTVALGGMAAEAARGAGLTAPPGLAADGPA